MIKLDVQEYCHECPYFEAVMVPGYCNKAIGAGGEGDGAVRRCPGKVQEMVYVRFGSDYGA